MIMPTIRVTCPMCGKLLEVDAEHAGREVECGECFQIFVAETPQPPKIRAVAHDLPPGVKGKPRRQRDDDDYEPDEDDEFEEFDRPPGAGSASGTAVAALIVGVLALVTACCPLTGVAFGITAMVLGSSAKRYSGPSGAATAATVLGSVACLISLAFVAWMIAIAIRGGGN
jgi:hypothetical protein